MAILISICFDAPLGAAKETPKRVPKQTGAKCLVLKIKKKLAILKTIRFDTPLGFAESRQEWVHAKGTGKQAF